MTLRDTPSVRSGCTGKVVLVDFWATWCAPCRTEIPQLAQMQKTYGPQGLQVIGLSMDDTVPPVKAFLRQQPLPYPVAMADEQTIKTFGGVLGLPVNVILGRDGQLVARYAGVSDMQALQKEVEKALTAR
ncbi:MAG TPA: TlpA disulfide reductase family protein [Candidatus Koribacter sp.]|jgi:thiol-disulfide isomerase/thioredoxin